MVRTVIKVNKWCSIYSLVYAISFAVMILYYSAVNSVLETKYRDRRKMEGPYFDWSPSLEIPLVTVVCSRASLNAKRRNFGLPIYTDMARQKEQIRVMLGSLLYFSRSPKWRLILITDTQGTYNFVTDELKVIWPKKQYERLQLERRSLKMPSDENTTSLLAHYRPCAWQKLFLDMIFPELTALVFMDSDVVFTGPAEELWKIFSKFNSSQALAASPEPWYVKDGDRPYAGSVGINTGVLALNLTRLKLVPKGGLGFAVIEELSHIQKRPRHDQDMVNIVLRKHPQFLYELSYKWNFIPSDCTVYAMPCKECYIDGISIVHGADAIFYRPADGRFMALYNTLKDLTEHLNASVVDELLLYQGRIEGADLFHNGFICSNFRDFFWITTLHMKRVSRPELRDALH